MRCFLFALLLLMPGCRPFTETDAVRILHSGEAGVFEHGQDEWIYGALDKSSVHQVTRAVETGDQVKLEQFMRSGNAIRIHVDTRVTVLKESFNERLVRVEEGPSAGVSVWVPYEWLKRR